MKGEDHFHHADCETCHRHSCTSCGGWSWCDILHNAAKAAKVKCGSCQVGGLAGRRLRYCAVCTGLYRTPEEYNTSVCYFCSTYITKGLKCECNGCGKRRT